MSKICSSCGAELEDAATFCGKCGKPVSLFTPTPEETMTTSGDMPAAENFSAQPQQPQQGGYGQQPYQNMNAYSQSANVYNQSQFMGLNETTFSPYDQKESPVSVGQWMLTTLLLCIPLVGIIYFIILAIGGPNTKKSLTNYARASLVWLLIIFAFYIVAFMALGVSFNEIMKNT